LNIECLIKAVDVLSMVRKNGTFLENVDLFLLGFIASSRDLVRQIVPRNKETLLWCVAINKPGFHFLLNTTANHHKRINTSKSPMFLH
jgi:hypothetical protein